MIARFTSQVKPTNTFTRIFDDRSAVLIATRIHHTTAATHTNAVFFILLGNLEARGIKEI